MKNGPRQFAHIEQSVGASSPEEILGSPSPLKRFLHHTTVEPFVFLAVFALFVELPTVQDLIYTKICIQNVGLNNLHNLTTQSVVQNYSLVSTSKSLSQNNKLTSPNAFNESTITSSIDTNPAVRILPPSGRIQEINIWNDVKPVKRDAPSALSLCSKSKKSALPKDIGQRIFVEYSSFWLKYQLAISILVSLSCPYWGGMSDKIGRLIPMNVPIAIAVITNTVSLCMGVLISLDLENLYSINWFYLNGLLTGITGGLAVILLNAFGFIGDTTSTEDRTKRITILETTNNISQSFGFFVSSYLLKLSSDFVDQRPWANRYVISFSCCIIANIICILYSSFRLRHHKFHRLLNNFERELQESVAGESPLPSSSQQVARVGIHGDPSGNEQRSQSVLATYPTNTSLLNQDTSSYRSILTLRYYLQTFQTLAKRRQSRTTILLLLLCGFISSSSLATLMSLLYIYLRSEPFNWDSSQYSSWNSKSSLTRLMALVVLSICMRFVKGWNIPDPLISAIGFLSKGTGLLMLALAQSASLINYWALLAFILSDYSMPPIRSIISKLAVKEELGKIYSCLGAILSLCFVVTNLAFLLGFATVGQAHFYRLCFLVIAALQFSGFAIMLAIYTNLRKRPISL